MWLTTVREGKRLLTKGKGKSQGHDYNFFFLICVIVASFALSPHTEFPSLSNYVSTNEWDQLPGCSQLTSASHLQSSTSMLSWHWGCTNEPAWEYGTVSTICAHVSVLTLSCRNSFCLRVWGFSSQIPCRKHIFHRNSQYCSSPKICKFWVACVICIQETAYWDIRCRSKAGLSGHFSIQRGKSILSGL